MRLAALLLVLVGCGQRGAEAPAVGKGERYAGPMNPPRESEVVATVNGERIYAVDLARQMKVRGQRADEAIQELIAAELLAQEAFRRGLAGDPDVVDANKRERVRVLVTRDFERSFDGPEDVPQDMVDTMLSRPNVLLLFDHEPVHDVAYIRAQAKKTATPEVDAAARAAAYAFYDLARAERPATREEFFAVAQRLPAGMKVTAAPTQRYQTTRDQGPGEPSFAHAAFTLKKKGDVSEPARTPWGWDVIYLHDIIPAKHTPRAEIEADIRKRIFEEARRAAWTQFLDRLLADRTVQKNEALLDLVEVDSLVGM
jgi:hypothetical protein